ncbi:MAG: hypothetical protein BGO98_29615 [Myxococcales bacterium 68-20]|nr:MAG: hypothetical protein BGO98_29615 [Myxococcales bacterium 68-20]
MTLRDSPLWMPSPGAVAAWRDLAAAQQSLPRYCPVIREIILTRSCKHGIPSDDCEDLECTVDEIHDR